MPQVDTSIFILIVQTSLHLFFLSYGIIFFFLLYPFFKNMIISYKIFIKFFINISLIYFFTTKNSRFINILFLNRY